MNYKKDNAGNAFVAKMVQTIKNPSSPSNQFVGYMVRDQNLKRASSNRKQRLTPVVVVLDTNTDCM